jgi:hypothetical protein
MSVDLTKLSEAVARLPDNPLVDEYVDANAMKQAFQCFDPPEALKYALVIAEARRLVEDAKEDGHE